MDRLDRRIPTQLPRPAPTCVDTRTYDQRSERNGLVL